MWFSIKYVILNIMKHNYKVHAILVLMVFNTWKIYHKGTLCIYEPQSSFSICQSVFYCRLQCLSHPLVCHHKHAVIHASKASPSQWAEANIHWCWKATPTQKKNAWFKHQQPASSRHFKIQNLTITNKGNGK